jgi:hypothetical protein
VADLNIQASFNTGEWAPALNARVDMQKYHSGCALARNFFVDYRGGLSTRTGTRYILQAYKSSTAVRLIPFQASFTVGYVLEFGDGYIRFYNDGVPVLEDATSITAAASGPPEVFTDAAHGYFNGEWLFIANAYYIVTNATTNTFTLTDLFGNAITTNPFTLPTSARRVYTITSPYAAADLATIKFAQNVNILVLCHPNYQPYILTLVTATNWTLVPIVFGSTATAPTGTAAASTLSSGSVNYSYVVTSVDSNGQESGPSVPATLTSLTDLRTTPGTNTITWTAAQGAVSYNVYEALQSYAGPIASGAQYGFIGNCTGVQFDDSNIAPDFSVTPPIPQNPFQGAGVVSLTITSNDTYTTVPTISIAPPPSGGVGAVGTVYLQAFGVPTITNPFGGPGQNQGYVVGDIIDFGFGIKAVVATTTFLSAVSFHILTYPGSSGGQVLSGPVPSNPLTGSLGSGPTPVAVQCDFNWQIGPPQLINGGAGYTSNPTVTVSSGTATIDAQIGPASNGNPSVPGFFQQRLVLANQTGSPQAFFMSQPGSFFNFNVSNPIQATDSISGTLVSGQLNTIKALITQPSGLITLTDKASWLLNGGSPGSAVSPATIVANAQSFNGASEVPPIVANFDILYVQAKGSIVRDSSYNFYANVFTGTDISVLSSHLFYGYTVNEWAWAEEPFKVVWAVRSDGTMLTLTFLKEQEFVGWTHSDTQGSFKSVATITEGTDFGSVDAVYTVVQRTVNGQSLQYIERFAERIYPNGVVDAWTVDAGIQYDGVPATTFSGGQHLAGLTCTGLADGQPITPFVMPASGSFTLASASKVTVGLPFTCQLQTLAIDLGEPTVQGKVKKINNVDVRVKEALGLKIGPDFNHLVPMKDLVRGNVSSMLTGQESQLVTDLVTGDARTFLPPAYTIPGQYCIQLDLPYPASILGVIPNITLGDTK